MKQLRFVLHNLIFYIATIFGLFVVESSTASFNKPEYGLINPFFFIFSFLSIGLMILYYFIDGKKNGFKACWVLISVLSVLYVSLIFSTIFVKNQSFTDSGGIIHSVVFTPLDKFKYCIEITILFLIIYALFAVFLNKKFSTKNLHWIFSLFVLFVFISIIASFFIDFKLYKDIFLGNDLSRGIKSFYINENIYGMAILMGILSLFILNVYKRRWFNYIFIIILFFGNIFSTCVTTILLSFGAILIYFTYEIIYSFKKNLVIGIVFLSLLLLFIFAFIVTYVILSNLEISWVVNLNKYLFNNIGNKDFKTLSSRTLIWNRIFKEILLTNPIYFIFGTGFKTSTILLKNMMSVGSELTSINSAHNGYVEIMLSSGLVGIIAYALFLILIAYISIKLMIKKKFRFAFIYDLCILVILGHGFAESTILFGLDTQNIIIGFLFVAPLFVEYRRVYKPEAIYEFVNSDEIKPTKLPMIKIKSLISSILFGLSLTTALLVFSNLIYVNKIIRNSIVLISILLFIYALFVPHFIVSLAYRNNKKKFIIKTILYLSLLLGLTFIISYVLLMNNIASNHALYIVPLFNVFALLMINIFISIKCSSFKAWWLSIKRSIISSFIGLLFVFLSSIIFYSLLPNFISMSPYILGIFYIFILLIYFIVICLSNIKMTKFYIKSINNKILYDYKQSLLVDLKN